MKKTVIVILILFSFSGLKGQEKKESRLFQNYFRNAEISELPALEFSLDYFSRWGYTPLAGDFKFTYPLSHKVEVGAEFGYLGLLKVGDARGITDLTLSAKYIFLDKQFKLAGGVTIVLPTGLEKNYEHQQTNGIFVSGLYPLSSRLTINFILNGLVFTDRNYKYKEKHIYDINNNVVLVGIGMQYNFSKTFTLIGELTYNGDDNLTSFASFGIDYLINDNGKLRAAVGMSYNKIDYKFATLGYQYSFE